MSRSAEPERLSGADIIFRVLAEEHVDVIFGYPGGAVLPLYDALFLQKTSRYPSYPRSA